MPWQLAFGELLDAPHTIFVADHAGIAHEKETCREARNHNDAQECHRSRQKPTRW